MRIWPVLVCAVAGLAAPRFEAKDVRPHGAAEAHPLRPGMLSWMFGTGFAEGAGCGVKNLMDPRTYQTELCGTRVVVGGIDAKLIAVMAGQINFVMPEGGWLDEMVPVQVIVRGEASAAVPVYFGFDRPVLTVPEKAYAGMPVWVHLEKPYGTGYLRYPFYTEPWATGAGWFVVRYEGRELGMIGGVPYPAPIDSMLVGLAHEPASSLLNRVPLHLLYPLDRPGRYSVRYRENRFGKQLDSDWIEFEVAASSVVQRDEWFRALLKRTPEDPVELLADFLPNVLARRDEAALRVVAQYLTAEDQVLRMYAGYALNYFDRALLKRVVPGREPIRGGVR